MDRREAETGSVRAHMIYDAHKKSVGASFVLCLLLGGLGATIRVELRKELSDRCVHAASSRRIQSLRIAAACA